MSAQTSAAGTEYIPGRARSETTRKVLLYSLYLVVAAIFFVPFLWTLTTSFKSIPDSVNVTFFAHPWTTHAWHILWTDYDFPT
jgi:ABC-type glycerol-3-phosphate transport system permease component